MSDKNFDSQLSPKHEESLFISKEVSIHEGDVKLEGSLTLPTDCKGIILFAHGSGSSRFSPRNQKVAKTLNGAGFGTLLFDLLSEEESLDRKNVFDIPLLGNRLVIATNWLKNKITAQSNVSESARNNLGFFGASTGAGAALWAAAELGTQISAVVSRGGRPDLAMQRLSKVAAPTLLIVGENDDPVIDMNRAALVHLSNGKMILIPGATHLFEEPGTLEAAAHEAVKWFQKYLTKGVLYEAA